MDAVTLRVTCKFIAKPARLCRNGPEAALTELGCSRRRRAQENGGMPGDREHSGLSVVQLLLQVKQQPVSLSSLVLG